MSQIPHIIGKESITILLDGRNVPVGRSHPHFNTVLDAIADNDLDTLRTLLNPKQAIADRSNGTVVLTPEGELWAGGEKLADAYAKRTLSMFRDGLDIKPMLAFRERLELNPSYRARNELYGFIDACQLPITEDGYFLAYKMIREDYTDIYTGTMDNSVGATPNMPRNRVDEDKDRTCSRGLHFASREYVQKGNYGSRNSGHRIVVVKVDPQHVVSIPTDYNNSKGRACEYLILEEIDWDTRIEVDAFGMDNESGDYDEEEEEEEEEEQDDTDDEEEEEEEEETSTVVRRPASAKLTEDGVRRFLSLLRDQKLTLTSACQIVGISRRQGGRIRDGENWADVE